MKKLFAVSVVISSFISSSALAKTEGSYAGLDVIDSRVKFHEEYTSDIVTPGESSTFQDNSNYGGGVNYKYAVNVNGFYFAPGVFFEVNNAELQGSQALSAQVFQKLKIKNRYGAKVDFGADITDGISAYLTGGYVGIRYRTGNFSSNASPEATYAYKNGVSGAWIYGGGLKFDITKTVSLNTEYTIQNFTAKTSTITAANFVGEYKTRMDVIKVGLSYNF